MDVSIEIITRGLDFDRFQVLRFHNIKMHGFLADFNDSLLIIISVSCSNIYI